MADQEQLELLLRSTEDWNRWRQEHQAIAIDLRFADLMGATLHYADLRDTDLRLADLRDATLIKANLNGANLRDATLSNAQVGWTLFASVDLRTAKGLDTVRHLGPSTIGTDTLVLSEGAIPDVFLRGAGLSDTFLEYIHSLVGKPIEYYSCFLSYSSKDQEFAERLYADLQSKGVRCWFAPHDLRPGTYTRQGIDEAIRMYDKLILILSEYAITSGWVQYEAEIAMHKERERNALMLFPIRIDAAIMTCQEGWATTLRARHIGDFTCWEQHMDYQQTFTRLLRDLKAETPLITEQG